MRVLRPHPSQRHPAVVEYPPRPSKRTYVTLGAGYPAFANTPERSRGSAREDRSSRSSRRTVMTWVQVNVRESSDVVPV
jgi:hypothetical protein